MPKNVYKMSKTYMNGVKNVQIYDKNLYFPYIKRIQNVQIYDKKRIRMV